MTNCDLSSYVLCLPGIMFFRRILLHTQCLVEKLWVFWRSFRAVLWVCGWKLVLLLVFSSTQGSSGSRALITWISHWALWGFDLTAFEILESCIDLHGVADTAVKPEIIPDSLDNCFKHIDHLRASPVTCHCKRNEMTPLWHIHMHFCIIFASTQTLHFADKEVKTRLLKIYK